MKFSGDRKWLREAAEKLFRLITTTLLSLLLPLSFLFLSRLSSSSFFLSLLKSSPYQTSSFYLFPVISYVVVSVITVYTLVLGFSTKITETNPNRSIYFLPHVGIAWLVLSLVQVSVGLGLQETVLTGLTLTGSNNNTNNNFLSKLVFFFGLHEVMLLWSRVIVKPVVDNTLGGGGRRGEETVVERVALAVSCGSLWWWKLRDEVEGLVGVVEAKKALLLLLLPIEGEGYNGNLEVGILDFVNWWLYYMVVTIGMVRIVKGCLWFGMVLLFEQGSDNNSRRRRRDSINVSMDSSNVHFDVEGDDNKV